MTVIWSALDFWQKVGIVSFAVFIPIGIIAEMIMNRDLRAIYRADKRKKREGNKA